MNNDSRNKVCPYCGNSMFKAVEGTLCLISTAVDENGNHYFHTMKKSNQVILPYGNELQCNKCGKELTVDDLIEGTRCKECGKIISPSEASEDGLCSVCHLKREEPEIANMSYEELLFRYAQVSRELKNISIDNKISTAEETINNAVNNTEDTENKPQERTTKRKKRASKVITETVTEEQEANIVSEIDNNTEENIVTNKEINEAVNDINSDNAPFPNIALDNVNSEENIPSENTLPNNEEFPLFDNSTEDNIDDMI